MANFIMIDRRVAVSASNKRLLRMVALLLIAILVLTGCNRKAMQLGMRKATQGHESIDTNVASTSGQLGNLETQDHAEGKYLLEILEQQGYYKEIEGNTVCLSFPNCFEERNVKKLLTYICRNKHIENFILDTTGLWSCRRLHFIIEELLLAFVGTSVHTFILKDSDYVNLLPLNNIVLSKKFSMLEKINIKKVVVKNVDFGDEWNLRTIWIDRRHKHTPVHFICFDLCKCKDSNVDETFSTILRLIKKAQAPPRDLAAMFAKALEKNNTGSNNISLEKNIITRIVLGNNTISDAGAAALAKALEKNNTITGIVLTGNPISDAGVAALAIALGNNTISDAGVEKNNITQAALEKPIAEEIEKTNSSSSLVSINWGGIFRGMDWEIIQ